MKHNFPYLRDTAFLAKLDRIKVREEYVKIMQNNNMDHQNYRYV